jgi:hypothetical protein
VPSRVTSGSSGVVALRSHRPPSSRRTCTRATFPRGRRGGGPRAVTASPGSAFGIAKRFRLSQAGRKGVYGIRTRAAARLGAAWPICRSSLGAPQFAHDA